MTNHTRSKRFAQRRQQWRQIVAQQQRSGLAVRAFCLQQGINEHSFYLWRKRLRHNAPVSFALVETTATERAKTVALELHLAGGERLQISAGVDAATLRTVLAVLREPA
jgi:transposase-like protein